MARKNTIKISDKEKFFGEYYSKYKQHPVCPMCGKEIQRADLDATEYIKTKSGTEFFAHRACILGKKVKKDD